MAVFPHLERKCVWTCVLILLTVLTEQRCQFSASAQHLVEDVSSVNSPAAPRSAFPQSNDQRTVTLRAEDFHNLINALVDTVKLLRESGTKCCSGCESKPMMMPWTAVPMIPMNQPWFTVQPYYLPPAIGPLVPYPPVAPHFVFGAGNGTFYNSKGSWIYPWSGDFQDPRTAHANGEIPGPPRQPLRYDITAAEQSLHSVMGRESLPAESPSLQVLNYKIWDLDKADAPRFFNSEYKGNAQLVFDESSLPISPPPSLASPQGSPSDAPQRDSVGGSEMPWIRTMENWVEPATEFVIRNPSGVSLEREDSEASGSNSEDSEEASQSLGSESGYSDDSSSSEEDVSAATIVESWEEPSDEIAPLRDPTDAVSIERGRPTWDYDYEPRAQDGYEESDSESEEATEVTLLEAVVTESMMFHHVLISTESQGPASFGPHEWPETVSFSSFPTESSVCSCPILLRKTVPLPGGTRATPSSN